MIRILVGVVIVFVAAGARGQVTRNSKVFHHLLCHFCAVLSFMLFNILSVEPLVCYYGSWAKYRQGIGKFTVANIKPELCDYITYTFVGLTASLDINLMDLDGKVDGLFYWLAWIMNLLFCSCIRRRICLDRFAKTG